MALAESPDKPEASKVHRKLLLGAACMTYLLITMGGVVCITGAARACPDWPGCYGRMVPPLRIDSVIEYAHRLLALCTASLIVIAAAFGWLRYRRLRWLSVPPLIAIVLVCVVAMFGAMAVLRGLSPALAAVDLGLALLVLALMVAASVIANFGCTHLRFSRFFSDSFGRWASCCVVAVFAVLATGPLGGENGPMRKCLAWPLYTERSAALGSLDVARYLLADFAALCIVMLVIQAWHARLSAPALLRSATVAAASLVALFVLGAFISTTLPWGAFAYIAITAGLWAALIALVTQAGLASGGIKARTPIGSALVGQNALPSERKA